jgi:hypothetical protein
VTYEAIKKYETLPNSACLLHNDVHQKLVEEVAEAVTSYQLELAGITEKPDIAEIVQKMTHLVVQQTIDIPRILVVPTGEVQCGYTPFALKLNSLRYQPPSDELWVQHLRTNAREVIALAQARSFVKKAGLDGFADELLVLVQPDVHDVPPGPAAGPVVAGSPRDGKKVAT